MDGGSPRGKTNAGVTDTGRKITTQQLTMLGKKKASKASGNTHSCWKEEGRRSK